MTRLTGMVAALCALATGCTRDDDCRLTATCPATASGVDASQPEPSGSSFDAAVGASPAGTASGRQSDAGTALPAASTEESAERDGFVAPPIPTLPVQQADLDASVNQPEPPSPDDAVVATEGPDAATFERDAAAVDLRDLDAGGEAGVPLVETACGEEHNDCDDNATCTEPSDAGLQPICECTAGYVGDGRTCALPESCLELAAHDSTLPSGEYELAGGAPGERVLCDMETAGGGWTLVVNAVAPWDPVNPAMGTVTDSYTGLLIENGDIMVDFLSNQGALVVRAAFTPPANDFRGYSAASVLTTTRFFNSDLDWTAPGSDELLLLAPAGVSGALEPIESPAACDTRLADYPGLALALCEDEQLTVADANVGSTCADTVFALGTSVIGNCTGWPQNPGTDFPAAVRIWVR